MSIKRNTIANYAGSFYLTFVNILAVPFYVKLLGAEAYGLVGFFAMLQSWLHLFDLGMSPTLSREMARFKAGTIKPFELLSLVRSLECFFIGIGLVIALGLFFCSEWVATNWLQVEGLSQRNVYYSVMLMGMTIPLRWILSLYRSGLVGMEQHVWLNVFNIVFSTLKAFGVIIALLAIEKTPVVFFSFQAFLVLIEVYFIISFFYRNLPRTNVSYGFSFSQLKRIMPFAGSIAFTSGIWLIVSKTDKLILSNSLSLKEYGFFSLGVTVSEAISIFTSPVAKVLLPRMTFLVAKNNITEMVELYRKATQIVSVITCSFVGIIAYFAQPLLFAWLNQTEAAVAAAPVLFWYSLGNAVLAIMAFQYYLQFAFGILKFHVRFNIVFAIIWVPAVLYIASSYDGVATGKLWFLCQSLFFVFWTWFIHNKFVTGLHKKWLFYDILPSVLTTIILLNIFSIVPIDFLSLSRIAVFAILLFYGLVLLLFNTLIAEASREMFFNFLRIKGNICFHQKKK